MCSHGITVVIFATLYFICNCKDIPWKHSMRAIWWFSMKGFEGISSIKTLHGISGTLWRHLVWWYESYDMSDITLLKSIWCHSVKPSMKALCDDIPYGDKDTTCVKALHEMSQLHEICLVNQHAAETGQRQGGMTYCSHPTRQSLRTEESQHLGDYFPSQPAMLSIPLRVIGSDSHQACISTLLPFWLMVDLIKPLAGHK